MSARKTMPGGRLGNRRAKKYSPWARKIIRKLERRAKAEQLALLGARE